jgi:hypothetical protein
MTGWAWVWAGYLLTAAVWAGLAWWSGDGTDDSR